MDSNRWQQIESLVQAALEIPNEERAAWLDANCDGDNSLRDEVESLLVFEKQSESILDKSVFVEAAEILLKDENDLSRKGQHIGQYKILQEIGRGGMGVVYLAAREDEQFRKRVAIKLIKRGLDTEDVLRRFRNERQILASLHHPNIASLLDGGTTEDGLPYFVMEYIEGSPLLEHCDEHQLSTNERLQLFRTICSAVQHAHQNLVIHRDLKPSNILITYDGELKLLDFGVAKFLNPELMGDGLAQTQTEFRVMTPEYASPEQVRGQHITTATDIYSLGVILYELLTGSRPYKLKDTSPEELIHAICDSEPTKPSDAVSGHWSVVSGQSNDNRQNPKSKIQNPKSLKGDLDNIVLMALRKEPSRRYKSVEQFSEDIERHLKGLPVIARKDTFAYRTEKFIQRNKVGVIAASLVLIAIFTGLIATTWQARVAARERDQAQREKVKAEQLNNFLQSMLSAANPDSKPSEHDLTVKEILDEASKRLATADLANQPEVKAELQRIIAASYYSLGKYDLAEQNLSAALEAHLKIYGEEHPETLKTMVLMAQLWSSRGDNQKANNFYEQRISILRTEYKKGIINADVLIAALGDFAVIKRSQSNSEDAEMLLREALALSSQASSEAKTGIDVLEGVLALTLADQGKFDEAIKIVRDKVANLRNQPNPFTQGLAANLTGLGSFLSESGNYAEATENLQEAETIYRKLFNPTFLPLGDNLRLQAQAFYLQGRYEEAEAKIRETLQIYRSNTNTRYINYPTALTIQGLIFNKTNRALEAEKILREAVELREKTLPKGHFMTALAKGALGECLITQKKFAEAETLLTESFESLKQSQGAENPRTILAQNRLNRLYEVWKK